MTRRAHKIDGNQPVVFETFARLGCHVIDLSALGNGAPDCLVHIPGAGWRPVEIKMPGEGLTEAEKRAHRKAEEAGAHIEIIYGPEQAADMVYQARRIA